jgi:hypothetical protein
LSTLFYFLTSLFPDQSVNFLKPLIPEVLKVFTAPCPIPQEAKEWKEVQKTFAELKEIISPAPVAAQVAAPGPSKSKSNDNGLAKATDMNKKKETPAEKTPASASTHPSRFMFTPAEEERLHAMTPPDDFRDIPIIPTIDELLNPEDSFLRPNRKMGGYRDADHYLDVQFRLFREDFLRPLKNGIQEFMRNR